MEGTDAPSASAAPLRILSLDGGGIRGLSSLMILEEIMEKIRKVKGLDEAPRPSDHFDLIGGTSTGGIIAIMLGRLGLTVSECIRAYRTVAQRAFTPKRLALPASPSGAFSATALEAAIKQVVHERHCVGAQCAGDCPHAEVLFRDESCTKTVVLAITKENIDASPTLFRTYDKSDSFRDCAIWQVVRATSAATTFFKPIKLGRDQIEFVDAGFGYNNPCDVLIQEALREFPGRADIRILSVGTGLGDAIAIKDSRRSIIHALKKMASATKKVADAVESGPYGGLDRYFRFNVERGLQDVSLSDCGKTSNISAHTSNYIRDKQRELNRFVEAFLRAPVADVILELRPRKEGKFIVPYTRNPDFVGRSDILEKLKDQLGFSQGHMARTTAQPRLALFGLGGVGKTQIATSYTYWLRATCPQVSIFWVHASNEERFRQAFTSIAKECGIPGYVNNPKAEVLPLVKKWLERRDSGPWLLILDNADDLELFFHPENTEGTAGQNRQTMRQYIPECSHGSILVTTRNRQTGVRLAKGGSRVLEISKMDEDESYQLVSRSLGHGDLDPEEAALLSSRLEHLPLALTQAAAYIQENDVTIGRYIQLLDETDRSLAIVLSKDFEPVGRDSETPHAVTSTWIVSFEQIARQDPVAAELLSLMCFFDRQAIPMEFLSFYVAELRQQGDGEALSSQVVGNLELETALGILKAFSFISRGRDSDNLDMHRLVQLVTRNWLANTDPQNKFQTQALVTVAALYPNAEFETRTKCNDYLPHAHAVLRHGDMGASSESRRKAELLTNVASFFEYQEQFMSSIPLRIRALEVGRRFLGEEDRETLYCAKSLANAYERQGMLKEAEGLQLKALEVATRVYGENDPVTLASMAVLASIYRSEGRLEEAVELGSRVLKDTVRVHGEGDPQTLWTMGNLTTVYLDLRQLEEAERLALRLRDLRAGALGDTHPYTLSATGVLVKVLWRQGRLGEAEDLGQRVLEDCVSVNGDLHPDVLGCMALLGSIYCDHGRLDKAAELEQRAHDAILKLYGEEHRSTLATMLNLSRTHRRSGRLDEAEDLATRALDGLIKLRTREHPDTAHAMFFLALIRQDQSRLAEAIALMTECLQVRRRVLPPDHVHTLQARDWLMEWQVEGGWVPEF